MIFTNKRQKLNRQSSIGGLSVLLLSALVFVLIPTIAEAQSVTATPGDGRIRGRYAEIDYYAGYFYHYYKTTDGAPSDPTWTDITADNSTLRDCFDVGSGNTQCNVDFIVDGLINDTEYTIVLRDHSNRTVSDTATPRAAPEQPTDLTTDTTVEGRVILTWTNPSDTNITGYQIRYRRSGDDETFDDDDESDWTPIPNSDANTTTHTVTGLFGVEYIFEIRALDGGLFSQDQAGTAASLTITPTGDLPPMPPPPLSPLSPAPVAPPAPPPGTVLVLDCPIAWKSQNAAGDPTPRVFIRAVEVDIANNPLVGVYKATAIEIYADPTDARTDLDGWTLEIKRPYDVIGIDYPLTAENSVFDAQGVLRIESTQATPFPTTDLRISNGPLPGFDYRLFDEQNQPVDVALACYRGLNTFAQLRVMGAPRIERSVDFTDVVWEDVVFLRSEWRVPAAAPSAPSLPRRLTTLWGSLKKQ